LRLQFASARVGWRANPEGPRGAARAQRKGTDMAKMTKSKVLSALADKAGISRKQAGVVVSELVALALKNAKDGFMIPGLGKLVLSQRPAREMVMRFGPKAGQTVKVPAKKVLKFRIAKVAKDAVLGKK